MRPLRFVRRNPLPVLGAFALGFAFWVWRDATDEPAPQVYPLPSGVEFRVAESEGQRRFLPQPPELVGQKLTPQDTAQVLPKLKPGMTRTEVEGLVGSPGANDIHPATIADGKVTYQTSYEADLEPPATVRPIKHTRISDRPVAPPARTLVTLEFDATKPGHPLLGIYYPDPLF